MLHPLPGKRTLIFGCDNHSILRASRIIKKGGLVAFPTETVYGLGADATNEKAVARIFQAKGRPQDNPLIVHISNLLQLETVARDIPSAAYTLAQYFWPGPLSLVLHKHEAIPEIVSAGLDSVAVRMPADKIALNLIKKSGVPLAAPSANLSGKPSPTLAIHVLADLTGRVDAVINHSCRIGLESTVLDLTGPIPVILRPGEVTADDLEKVLKTKVLRPDRVRKNGIPRSPGIKYRHYSPQAPLILITGRKLIRKTLIKELEKYYQAKGYKIINLNRFIEELGGQPQKVEQFARLLYNALRKTDYLHCDLILVEQIDDESLGRAVMNRLGKAATRILKV